MENSTHSFSELFDQLGLPSDEASIREFCATHSVDEEVRLPDAEFWTAQQAQFLRESWHHDSDWAIVIDQLNNSLVKPH
ncbi:MAG: DUF2789 domain-containing protein [Spongiibacteraceae bacterium]